MKYRVGIYHTAVTYYEVEAESHRDAYNKAIEIDKTNPNDTEILFDEEPQFTAEPIEK